jgi:hypothetical protein
MSKRIPLFGAAAAIAMTLAWPAAAQSADAGVMYRCPGNDYSNTLTPAEADKLHCKKVENAAVTVIQSSPGAASSAASAPPARPVPAMVEPITAADSAAMRARASNARRDLEGRLKAEEGRLSRLEQEFNGGEPERHIDEFDFQKYLDRVARMRSEITRKQIEIAELRREIGKLPTR